MLNTINRISSIKIVPFINLAIRVISLGLKFLFVIFLGKYSVDESNLGIYGIFTSSITYSFYILGFEYYIYVSRNIVQKKDKTIEYYIKHQLFFYVITYVFILPIILFFLITYDFIESSYFIVFVLVLFFEHMGQEIFRLLSVLKQPIRANILLLLRSFWIFFSMLHYIVTKEIDIVFYFYLWALTSFASFLLGSFFLKENIKFKQIIKHKIDLSEVKRGVKVASFFLVSSLSVQTILLSGRFFLDFYYDKRVVGVYTFFSQFINIIEVFIYNLVVMIIFPYILENAKTDKVKFQEYVLLFKRRLFLVLLVSSVCLAIAMPFLVDFLNKEMATDYLYSFYILLLSAVFYNLSLIPHYILYSYEKDKSILFSAICSVLINISLSLLLVKKYGITGVVIAYLVSMLFILFSKLYYKNKYI